MVQSNQFLLRDLGQADELAFERGMRDLSHRWMTAADSTRQADVLSAFGLLSRQNALGSAEVARRARLILDMARLPDELAAEIARMARTFPPPLRNAVTSGLPPALRRLVYEPATPSCTPTIQASDAAEDTKESAVPLQVARFDAQEAEAQSCRAVLLLGTAHDHEGNTNLLRDHRFTPVRLSDADQLDNALNDDVCGIVISRTWWTTIPANRCEKMLDWILGHSTFAWLKLDASNLPCDPARLRSKIREARFDEPSAYEFACHDGCQLTPVDIRNLEDACRLLSNSESVRLCPAEIKEKQARVLVGSASKQAQRRDGDGVIRLTKVETSVLPGGRSGALVVRLQPDDGGVPFVAKIGDIRQLAEEMRRFCRHAAKWDHVLNPQFDFHAGAGLILFTLVESPDKPGVPAPTLEERMDDALYGELYPDAYRGPPEDGLRQAVVRAISKLRQLNCQPCDAVTVQHGAWIGLDSLEATLARGMGWSIPDLQGTESNVFALRGPAMEIAGRLARKATVHGDVQLRNILVKDDREPHFIDYAMCGPGHPCFDLVRLESALLFGCFRMTASEARIACMHHSLLTGATEADIASEFPELVSSIGNRLGIAACVASRTAALEILTCYGGTEDDYLALKYIVACQSLLLNNTQKGVVRGLLGALASLLRGRDRWRTSVGPENPRMACTSSNHVSTIAGDQ